MVFLAARKDDSNMNLIIIIDKLNYNLAGSFLPHALLEKIPRRLQDLTKKEIIKRVEQEKGKKI